MLYARHVVNCFSDGLGKNMKGVQMAKKKEKTTVQIQNLNLEIDYDKLADAILYEGIHGALQQRAFAYLEQALRRVERERTKSRGCARSKNDGFHRLLNIDH